MSEVDKIFDAVGRASLRVQHADLLRYAADAARPRCGDCAHWMRSRSCPREHNVNGYTRGPSCDGAPCGQFSRTEASVKIEKERYAKADAFASLHGIAPTTPA